jgi:hypothetical protein
MKLTAVFLVIFTIALPLRSENAPAASIDLRLQQIDENVALKQYERIKMELAKVEVDLTLKGIDGTQAEKDALTKKIEILSRKAGYLQQEIRTRGERIAAALHETQPKQTPAKCPQPAENKPVSKPEEKKTTTSTPPATTAPAAQVPDKKSVETEVASLQKKIDYLNAEIEKRRAARGKLTQDTPEFAAADKLVQDLKPEIYKATSALNAAKAKLK